MKAGATMVCARAKRETVYIHPQQQPLSQVQQEFQGMDYVLLEGDYRAMVPRLVAAHGEREALARTNGLTIAYVGRVSNLPEIVLPHPSVNALTDAGTLLDLIDETVPEIEVTAALDEELPPVPGVSDDAFCQCGCHHAQKTQEDTQLRYGGRSLWMTSEREAMLRRWAEEDGYER